MPDVLIIKNPLSQKVLPDLLKTEDFIDTNLTLNPVK